MISAKDIRPGQISQTKEMIRCAVLSRGWDMWLIDLQLPIIVIKRKDGKCLHLYGATPPTTPYVAAMVANDKIASHQLFVENGLPTPGTRIIDSDTSPSDLFDNFGSVVVKPVDGAHGNGITVAIKNKLDIEPAIEYAKQFSSRVLVQEFIDSAVDIRVLCINYEFVAALIRIPARVSGDGTHTIKQLIIEENNNGSRGVNYAKEMNVIDLEKAKKFLGEKINTIPKKDQIIEVVGTANVGSGGETNEVTGNIPNWLREMSEKAAKVSELTCCGVDFLLKAEPKPESTQNELAPKIIEINKSPSLFIHEKPNRGKPQPVVEKFVDYLASL